MLYGPDGKLIDGSSALKRYELGHAYPSAWARHQERACFEDCHYCRIARLPKGAARFTPGPTMNRRQRRIEAATQ
jgi:hypothetical protein